MHITRLTVRPAIAILLALPFAAQAQDVRVWTAPLERSRVVIDRMSDRPMIGVTTAQESRRADTLGLLIDDVQGDSPASKAGLKAGDRLQAVNGVSLRADRADAGERDYDGVLSRRLAREVEKTEAGKAVELRVYADGRTRTVSVTPVKMSELYGSAGGYAFSASRSDRAVVGFTIGSTGSARDTLGVFVSAVTTGGPADKAGIIEGDRIASINGVSVRVAREDAEDRAVGAAKANRLRREIEKLEAGETADLVVVTAGRSRTVRVTLMKSSELPSDDFEFSMPAGIMMPRFAPSLAPRAPTPPTAVTPATPRTPPVPPTPARGGTVRMRIITL